MGNFSHLGRNTAALAACCIVLFWLGPSRSPAARPYAVAHQAPLEPAESLILAADRYQQFRVEFNGIGADRVPAFLYVPRDGIPKHSAVLLQYGSGGNKKTDYIVAIARQFVHRGFVVLTIDIPGRGERKPSRKPTVASEVLQFKPRFRQTMGDYGRAVDYLVSRPEVDPARLGYVGISWGAITGIPFAAHDPRIGAVASLVGGGNFAGWVPGRAGGLARLALLDIDPVHHVAAIGPRPLLLINATQDQLVPRFFSDSLHNAAPPGAKRLWLKTDHIFSGLDRTRIVDEVISFIDAGLPAPQPRP